MTMKEIKLTIPEGCKTVTVKVDGEQVITEFEPKQEEWTPKDGDIYAIGCSVAIYNGNYKTSSPNLIPFYCGLRSDGYLCFYEPGNSYGFGYLDEIRPATDEEKQRLFDALAKEGKRWNAEKKCIEDLPRWRAKENETYYFIGIDVEVMDNIEYGYSCRRCVLFRRQLLQDPRSRRARGQANP